MGEMVACGTAVDRIRTRPSTKAWAPKLSWSEQSLSRTTVGPGCAVGLRGGMGSASLADASDSRSVGATPPRTRRTERSSFDMAPRGPSFEKTLTCAYYRRREIRAQGGYAPGGTDPRTRTPGPMSLTLSRYRRPGRVRPTSGLDHLGDFSRRSP